MARAHYFLRGSLLLHMRRLFLQTRRSRKLELMNDTIITRLMQWSFSRPARARDGINSAIMSKRDRRWGLCACVISSISKRFCTIIIDRPPKITGSNGTLLLCSYVCVQCVRDVNVQKVWFTTGLWPFTSCQKTSLADKSEWAYTTCMYLIFDW